MLLTIDPGLDLGWAVWNDELRACGLGPPDLDRLSVSRAWIEKPVVYPRSPVPPNDIVKLALVAGYWRGVLTVDGVDVNYVEPNDWKGSVPKPIHEARIWARLSPAEQAVADQGCKGVAPKKRHNVLDAIGLGLWVLKRCHY